MVQLSIRFAASLMRWTVRVMAALVLLLTLAWAVLHWAIVPRIDEFRPRLESMVSRAIGTPVTIGAIHAESNALVPAVSLHDVEVHDPTGRAGLRVPRMLAAFSVLSLARGSLEQLVIDQPDLELRRTSNGRLLAGGIDISGDAKGDIGAADWFFSQTEFLLRGGRITWIDELRGAPPVSLSEVQLLVRNGRRRHQIRLDATPQAGWGDRFTVIGQFRQPVFTRHQGQWNEWLGQIYVDLPHADLSQLRQYVDLKADWGVDLREGRGALRAWADVQKGAVVSATADLRLDAVSASFGPSLAPLAFGAVSGRLGWRNQAGAMDFDTRNLHFVDADGAVWPGGNFALNIRDAQGGQAAGGELRGDKLDLAALAKIASRLPLPPAIHERLKAHPVQGMVDSISARWDGPLEAPRDWRLQARLSALAIGAEPMPPHADGTPVEGAPGIDGAALELDATGAGGRAVLTLRDGALEFPGVFEDPRLAFNDLSLKTRWRVQGERIEVDVDELRLHNADATGNFKGHWHTTEVKRPGESRFPGVLDLEGAFSRANGARVHRYLPLGIPAEARHYVRDAILKGEARDFAVRVKGKLDDLPFDKRPASGEFRFAGQVSNVTMAYVPKSLQPKGEAPWPALEELAGELVFNHNSMQVKNAKARVQGYPGWQFPRIQASIADLSHTRVLVEAQGRGLLAQALDIVRTSPATGFLQNLLDETTANGDASLLLKLNLPIDQIQHAKVEGRVTLQGNELRITPESPLLTQAQGAISFSDTGFSLQDARARALGGEVRMSAASQSPAGGAPAVVVRASGTASAEALRQMQEWAPVPALARQATGSTAYELVVGFRPGSPDVLVTSDLRGIAFDLPPPLNKVADEAWPLRYEARQPPSSEPGTRQRLRVSVADQLALDYELDFSKATPRVLRGAIGVGPAMAQGLALPPSGVVGRLQLPRLDVDAWETAAERLMGGSAAPAAKGGEVVPARAFVPDNWSLRVGELLVDDRVLHELVSTGTRDGAIWRTDVQARELAGRVEYSEGADGRAGKVHARLSRLSVPTSAANEQASLLTEPPANIPALDIVVDDFELRGKKLGRLEVEAINRDPVTGRPAAPSVQEWQLTRLLLRAPEASFSATGQWAALARAPALPADPRAPRPAGDPRRTQLDFKLDIRDAGALLARMDMPGVVARGKGELEGKLDWAGSPFALHYPSLNGQLHLDVGAGQFLKASPGIGKLLGVISLQALPRRLTLDFRDVFSSGFAFDYVRGDVAVRNGVASTNNLQMKGVNAAVLMEGSANIDKETQDLQVLVVPEIDAGTAALAAAVINPAIGIGAFVAQLVLKQPLIKATTREFHVGGNWDNPQVTPTDQRARGAASAVPAAVPASAPTGNKGEGS